MTSQEAKERENTALVVFKSGQLTGEDTDIKMLAREPIQEEKEGEEESEESFKEEPNFLELNEATQKATKEVRLEDNPPDLLEQDEDEYQFVNRPSSSVFKRKMDKVINPADPYDLWKDLAQAKATISFGQLIQLAPSLRKEMRERATLRRERKIGQVNHLEDVKDADLHWSFDRTMENDFESVEIVVEVVDKQIPRTVIDDGANINIMPASTMQKLGLAITHPSLYSIRIADQALVKSMGQIKDLIVKTGGVNYQVNFEVLPMKRSISTVLNEEAYPLLLGRGFLRQCAGVVDWSTKKPTFTYGPPSNRTQVLIEPKVEKIVVKLEHRATTDPDRLLKVSTSTDFATKIAPHPRIKSFGLGLYDFVD